MITTSTAKVHVHHILEKLGVESRLQAALTPNADSDRSARLGHLSDGQWPHRRLALDFDTEVGAKT